MWESTINTEHRKNFEQQRCHRRLARHPDARSRIHHRAAFASLAEGCRKIFVTRRLARDDRCIRQNRHASSWLFGVKPRVPPKAGLADFGYVIDSGDAHSGSAGHEYQPPTLMRTSCPSRSPRLRPAFNCSDSSLSIPPSSCLSRPTLYNR